MPIFPITFAIPEEKIVDYIKIKTKILAHIIPGDRTTYIFNDEQSYYEDYRTSMFALTMKKAGWDCMRHLEIMANGCIPYFLNIDNCPEYILYLYPKNLFKKGNLLYEKVKDIKIENIENNTLNEIYTLSNELLNYTKQYLTTKNISQYILKSSGITYTHNILYLSGDTNPDYLRCVLLGGFKLLFGENCQDYPKIHHIYKDDKIDYKMLYGKGFTYSNLFDQSFHKNTDEETIINNIKNKKYNVIIYGSYHRGMPFFDLINKYYTPNKIILLCGEDEHFCNYSFFSNKGYNVFVRELH